MPKAPSPRRALAVHLAGHVVAAWATDLTGGRLEGKALAENGLIIPIPHSSRGRWRHLTTRCVVAAEAWSRAARGGRNTLQHALLAVAGDEAQHAERHPQHLLRDWVWAAGQDSRVVRNLLPRVRPDPAPPKPQRVHDALWSGIETLVRTVLGVHIKAVRRLADEIEKAWSTPGGTWTWDSQATSGLLHLI